MDHVSFDIRDYLQNLTPVEEGKKNRYYCPSCNGNNFEVEPKSGKYACFSGCTDTTDGKKEIIRAIKGNDWIPDEEFKRGHRTASRQPNIKIQKTTPTKSTKAVEIPSNLDKGVIELEELKAISETIPKDYIFINKEKKDVEKTTVFHYADGTVVVRYDLLEKDANGKNKKHFCQYHLQSESEQTEASKKKHPLVLSKGNYILGNREDKPCFFGQQLLTNEHSNKWLIVVEGESTAIALMEQTNLATLTLKGSAWTEDKIKQAIESLLTQIGEVGGLIFWPDNDEIGKKKMNTIQKVANSLDIPSFMINKSLLNELPPKGDFVDLAKLYESSSLSEGLFKTLELDSTAPVSDVVTKMIEWSHEIAIAAQIATQIEIEEVEEASLEETSSTKPQAIKIEEPPFPAAEKIAKSLAEEWHNWLAYNSTEKQFYLYEDKQKGVWGIIDNDEVLGFIRDKFDVIVEQGYKHYSTSTVKNTLEAIRIRLKMKFKTHKNLIPFVNGVYDLNTKKLAAHSYNYHCTWSLPYEFNPLAKCPNILSWLNETTDKDEDKIGLIRAYFAAIIYGLTNTQSFLELIGPGATGKSTLANLAEAMVGKENTCITSLDTLEKNQFETGAIVNKKLVLINDSDRYNGSVTVLKQLTGNDTIRIEKKYCDPTRCKPQAMVLMTANELPQTTDHTSGLERRRKTLFLEKVVPVEKRRVLISMDEEGNPIGDFVPELPGLINWCLAITPREAESVIAAWGKVSIRTKLKTLLATNAIAPWINDRVIFDPEAICQIGLAEKDGGNFVDSLKLAYANYCFYAQGSGHKPLAVGRFRDLLIDVSRNILNKEVTQFYNTKKSSFLKGLRLRDPNTDQSHPLAITGYIDAIPTSNPAPNVTQEANKGDDTGGPRGVETIVNGDVGGKGGYLEKRFKKEEEKEIVEQPPKSDLVDEEKKGDLIAKEKKVFFEGSEPPVTPDIPAHMGSGNEGTPEQTPCKPRHPRPYGFQPISSVEDLRIRAIEEFNQLITDFKLKTDRPVKPLLLLNTYDLILRVSNLVEVDILDDGLILRDPKATKAYFKIAFVDDHHRMINPPLDTLKLKVSNLNDLNDLLQHIKYLNGASEPQIKPEWGGMAYEKAAN